MKLTFLAFDRETSQSHTQTFEVLNSDGIDEAWKEFEKNVPFRKWYYEVEYDAQTPEEKEMVKPYEPIW